MTIKIQCPHCAQRISAPDDVLGTTVECPTCRQTFEAAAIEALAPREPSVAPPAAIASVAPATQISHAPRHPAPLRPYSPIQARKPHRGMGIVVTVAIAVLAGGLYCWHIFGPGLLPIASTFGKAQDTRGNSTGQSTADAPSAKSATPGTGETGIAKFQGTWRSSIPRTLVSKSYDVPVTIIYNDRGEGFPKFETPAADAAEFRPFSLATIYNVGGKNRVTLLRDWEISLSPDQQTMTWTEINGPAKLKFARE